MPVISEPHVVDARTRIVWGESPHKVQLFLQSKGVAENDALELITQLLDERAESVRADGVKKTWFGAMFIIAPIAYYFLSVLVGFRSLKLFSALILLGIVGIAKLASGLSMTLRPHAHKGDLSNAGD